MCCQEIRHGLSCLTRLVKYDEDDVLLEQSLLDLEPVRAVHVRDVAIVTERTAKLFDARGRPDRAAQLRTKQ